MLIGIGYIEKISKNTIKWVGVSENVQLESELKGLKNELNELKKEEIELENQIDKANSNLLMLSKEENTSKNAYLDYSDFSKLATQDETFIIVKAPKGSLLEVPEIEDSGQNLMFSTDTGEISLFILSNGKINSDYM